MDCQRDASDRSIRSGVRGWRGAIRGTSSVAGDEPSIGVDVASRFEWAKHRQGAAGPVVATAPGWPDLDGRPEIPSRGEKGFGAFALCLVGVERAKTGFRVECEADSELGLLVSCLATLRASTTLALIQQAY
jgi:hypothetical protein